jgi:hypothetical protein
MYGFKKSDDKNKLASDAFEAASRIYGAGIMVWNGRVGPGGNNVMADCAANAFNADDLVTLSKGTAKEALAAEIIQLRQSFAVLSKVMDARTQTAEERAESGREQGVLLEKIYDRAQNLEKMGWAPSMKPAVRSGYRPV